MMNDEATVLLPINTPIFRHYPSIGHSNYMLFNIIFYELSLMKLFYRRFSYVCQHVLAKVEPQDIEEVKVVGEKKAHNNINDEVEPIDHYVHNCWKNLSILSMAAHSWVEERDFSNDDEKDAEHFAAANGEEDIYGQ
uniref:Uncharacterized protein n=1 Tax=Lactuca sativa TaxID=4236 RepID=A0A9R1WNM6_LACSA|nr:hypothetical protein LSAT_V11C900464110 [Lactuca sativa]